jgi:hypothetical protein
MRYLNEKDQIGSLACWVLLFLLAYPPAARPDDHVVDAPGIIRYAEDSENTTFDDTGPTDMPGDHPAGFLHNPDGRLIYFAATGSITRNVVTVQWETRTEPWTSGYFVWRGENRDGSYVRIHHLIIASRGGDTWGGFYTFDDYGVISGKTYYYKIQEIEVSGINRFYGPVASDGSIDWHDRRDRDRVNISCFIDVLF